MWEIVFRLGSQYVLPLRSTNAFRKVVPVDICLWLNTLNVIITLTVVMFMIPTPCVVTNHEFEPTPQRYDDHHSHFYMEVTPPPPPGKCSIHHTAHVTVELHRKCKGTHRRNFLRILLYCIDRQDNGDNHRIGT